MHSIVVVAACLAVGHARRVQTPNFPPPVTATRNAGVKMSANPDVPKSSGQEDPSKLWRALAKHLLAFNPPLKSIISNRNPALQLRTQQRSTPLMVDDAAALQAQVALLQAELKDLQNPFDSQTHSPYRHSISHRVLQTRLQRRVENQILQKQKNLEELQAQLLEALQQQQRQQLQQQQQVVHGGALKTWTYRTSLDRVQVVLDTDGRPLDADVQIWQGPHDTPCKMRVSSKDGSTHPFRAVLAAPDIGTSTVAIRNIGQDESALAARVFANDVVEPISDFADTSKIVLGGSLRTFKFNTSVESVEIKLKTEGGRALHARIELLQGPADKNMQVIELYTEDGQERPFFTIVDTLGTGNLVRVVNTAPGDYPILASVQPFSINEKVSLTDLNVPATATTAPQTLTPNLSKSDAEEITEKMTKAKALPEWLKRAKENQADFTTARVAAAATSLKHRRSFAYNLGTSKSQLSTI